MSVCIAGDAGFGIRDSVFAKAVEPPAAGFLCDRRAHVSVIHKQRFGERFAPSESRIPNPESQHSNESRLHP